MTRLVAAAARHAGWQDWTDLGSGDGQTVLSITRGLTLKSARALVGEAHAAALEAAGWRVEHGDVHGWLGGGEVVSLLDVLEHLQREEGESLLRRLESAYRAIVVFTPRGFLRQDATVNPELATRPLMWHRSGWDENDFSARGYDVWYWPTYHLTPVGWHGAILAIRHQTPAPAMDKAIRLSYLIHLVTSRTIPRHIWLRLRRERL